MEWIDINDSLPEKGIKVLGFSNDAGETWMSIIIHDPYAAYDGTEVIFQNDEPRVSNISVTHWMPLPEPPKKEG